MVSDFSLTDRLGPEILTLFKEAIRKIQVTVKESCPVAAKARFKAPSPNLDPLG